MTPEELLAHAADFAFTPAGTTRMTPRVLYFTIHVTWRSEGRWSIGWMGEIWNGSEFQYEPLPSSRDDDHQARDHQARCRFGFDEAVQTATRLTETVELNGHTWTQWLEVHKGR